MMKGLDAKHLGKPPHDGINAWLVDRLWRGGHPRYATIDSFLPYHSWPYNGEFDVLTRTNNGFYHYYEVKSKDSPKARSHAYEQFTRALDAYPDLKWQFIYVTPTRILRVRPSDL